MWHHLCPRNLKKESFVNTYDIIFVQKIKRNRFKNACVVIFVQKIKRNRFKNACDVIFVQKKTRQMESFVKYMWRHYLCQSKNGTLTVLVVGESLLADLFVITDKTFKIFTRFRKFTLLHTLADVPRQSRLMLSVNIRICYLYK